MTARHRQLASRVGGLLALSLAALAAAQDAKLSISFTSTCPASEFFDTASLTCANCAQGFVSADQLGCTLCDTSTGATYSFLAGNSISQSWQPARGNLTCSCAGVVPPSNAGSGVVLATVTNAGSTLQRCITCPAGWAANSASQCVPVGSTLTVTSAQQDLQFVINALRLNINPATAIQASFPSLSVNPSAPLAVLLGPSARACLIGQNRAACNAVANLCVLQQYNGDTASCQLYDALVSYFAGTTASNRKTQSAARPTTGPLPWLYYGGNTYTQATDMGLSVSFRDGSLSSGTVSSLTFILSTYALNGTWLGYANWTTQFQICGMTAQESDLWHQFGWLYENNCELSMPEILAQLPLPSREPVFFDLFIQTSGSTLYPLPVKNANYDTWAGNRDNTQGAVRRFFFIDGSLGTQQTSQPSVSDMLAVQYPLSVRLYVTVSDDDPSVLLPPTLFLTYGAAAVSDSGTKSFSFTVTYQNPDSLNGRFWYAWRTCLIVFEVVISFPLALWKLYQYMRKRRGDQADQDFLVFGVVTVCDCGSLGLCCTLFVVSLYYLITYKLQSAVYFIMLQDDDVYNFRVCVILAVVGQSVAAVYRYWRQIHVDIFLLDWEKPRRVLSRDGSREENGPVSAWRTLMIANELSELQTSRATHLGFTWLMMVWILVGQGVQNAGLITPDPNNFTYYQTAVNSLILRFGVEAAFLLVLYLGQYLFRWLFWWPYVSDPVMNLVDLMYLANVSLVLLDEPHSGFYVHGRNHSQHSDATLKDLNVALEKEGEGLVGNRGLVTSYPDNKRLNENQLFRVYVTEEIRRQYEAKMLRQVEMAANDARLRKGQVISFVKGSGRPLDSTLDCKDDVSDLFREMVEEVERNHATQVIDPTYLERVFPLPPEAALHNTTFVHDYFRSFTNTMLIGNEGRQYLFEATFFLAVDSSLVNIPLSACLTYVVSRLLTWLLANASKNNLSDKTLVDHHFLI